MTENGWDVPSERPEVNSEDLRREKVRNDLRSEQTHGRQFNDRSDDRNAYDMVTRENEFPVQVPEFLTDEYLQEVISTSPMMTSILTRRSQHKSESSRLSNQIQSTDWLMS